METWKPIPDIEAYSASTDGRIKNNKTGRVLKPGIGAHGYPVIGLVSHGKRRTFTVHRLVANTFIPKEPHHQGVNHIDGDKTNNRLSNLERCTAQQNNRHAACNTLCAGQKLSGADMLAIQAARATIPALVLAKQYGVSRSRIYDICKGRDTLATQSPVSANGEGA